VSGSGGKRSRAALKALLDEDDLVADVSSGDLRADELRTVAVEEATALQAIREVFSGTGLIEDQDKVRRILRVRSEIYKEWSDARDSFLAIGRALVALEYDLSKAEFARLRQGTERLFPFSEATASQLRQIARAVDGGRIPAEACPGSYGTAYQITLLTETQLRAAQARGLIRPNVTRREIIQLRREVGGVEDEPAPSGRLDMSHLKMERSRLAERRRRLAEEVAAIDRRMAQLDDLLAPALDANSDHVENQSTLGPNIGNG
jgi:hypothetical protein